MVSAHREFELRFCVRLLVLLGNEEAGLLHTIHLHKFITRFRHWLVPLLLALQVEVKVLKLVVFLEYILYIGDLHGCSFGDLLLLFVVKQSFGVILLIVVHGGADFVLSFKDLDLCVFAPYHQFKRGLLLQTVQHSLLEIVHRERVLRQEIFDIVLESFFVVIFFSFLHRFHEGALLHMSKQVGRLKGKPPHNTQSCLRLKKQHHFINYNIKTIILYNRTWCMIFINRKKLIENPSFHSSFT